MNTKMIGGVVVVVALVGGAFYGGMQYAQGMRPGNGAARFAQFGGRVGGGGRTGGGSGAVAGEIIAKDDKSLTVKMSDGGSKIVFYSSETMTTKTVSSSVSGLNVGEQVMVFGGANQDGSVNAETIQERPTGFRGPGSVTSTPQ